MPSPSDAPFKRTPYTCTHPIFPYTPRDLTPMDSSHDDVFYTYPRLVTHIDDEAIETLQRYYAGALPRKGKVLDLCSSWISHFPPELEDLASGKAAAGGTTSLEVTGVGMNKVELEHNPILSQRVVQDLNVNPNLPQIGPLAAATCVVSIDYLTKPVDVLRSVHSLLTLGGEMHVVVSNRCFPTKAIGRWLRIGERERLEMVGDFLHFAGFGEIEIVTLSDGRRSDPLWVVKGRKAET